MNSDLHHKSLDRGITIMEILAREGSCSLANLHAQSGIPKSSIRRLLATMINRRLVRQSVADRKYRILVTMPLSSEAPLPTDQAYIVDIAMPVISAMTRKISWPSDIHLISGARMTVLDSTRPLSPFHLYRGVLNRHINMFVSATGMACLAEMDDAGYERIAAHCEGDEVWGLARYNISRTNYLRHLEKTRARGYGVRIARMAGQTNFDDGLAAIARPIYRGQQLLGAISILWPTHYRSPEQFAADYLTELKAATDAISEELNQFSPPT